jgi:hypothetical protein
MPLPYPRIHPSIHHTLFSLGVRQSLRSLEQLGRGFGGQFLFLGQYLPLAFLPQVVSEQPGTSQYTTQLRGPSFHYYNLTNNGFQA